MRLWIQEMQVSKGLVVKKRWLDLILSGEKTWEMRSENLGFRGPIALIEARTRRIRGIADLVDVGPALSRQQMMDAINFHRIPHNEIDSAIARRWVRPWVLRNVRRIDPPIYSKHLPGGSWRNLDSSAAAEIRRRFAV